MLHAQVGGGRPVTGPRSSSSSSSHTPCSVSSTHTRRRGSSHGSRSSCSRQQQQPQRQQQQCRVRVRATLRAEQADASSDPAAAQQQSERDVLVAVTRRIKALGEARKFKEAVAELASLATLGIQPDTQAATALLAACTRSRDMKLAEDIFSQLFGDFLQPDEVTFCVLLRGYGSRSPPDWQALDAVLTRMKNTYGIEPTSTSYNALLEVCLRSNDTDRALDVLDRMAADDVSPDEITASITAKKRTWRSYFQKLFA